MERASDDLQLPGSRLYDQVKKLQRGIGLLWGWPGHSAYSSQLRGEIVRLVQRPHRKFYTRIRSLTVTSICENRRNRHLAKKKGQKMTELTAERRFSPRL